MTLQTLLKQSKILKPSVSRVFLNSARHYSVGFKKIDYNDIQQLITKEKNYVLLDVRDSNEVQAGHIPTAKNVPLRHFNFAWDMTNKDFKENYGFEKPEKDERMITYCLKGVRSTKAANHLLKLGYSNVENYYGSYDDYLEKSKGGS